MRKFPPPPESGSGEEKWASLYFSIMPFVSEWLARYMYFHAHCFAVRLVYQLRNRSGPTKSPHLLSLKTPNYASSMSSSRTHHLATSTITCFCRILSPASSSHFYINFTHWQLTVSLLTRKKKSKHNLHKPPPNHQMLGSKKNPSLFPGSFNLLSSLTHR